MKKLLYWGFFVRSNNLNSVNNSLINRFFGQIPGQIVLSLFRLTSLRLVNSEKPRTICPEIDLKTGNSIVDICIRKFMEFHIHSSRFNFFSTR